MRDEGNNSLSKSNLSDLMNKAFSESIVCRDVKEYLLLLAKEGEFEKHQTRGTINQWAASLLQKIRKGDEEIEA